MRELAAVRHIQLVEHLSRVGSAKVGDLADAMRVTPQTIRGDIRLLHEQGLVERTHGGAMLRSRLENIGYQSRQAIASDAKTAIGAAAAALIPNNVAVFLNIGTITEAVARQLARHAPVKIANMANVDTFITDQILNDDLRECCARNNVTVIETGEKQDIGINPA